MTRRFNIMFNGHPYIVVAESRSDAIEKIQAKLNPASTAAVTLQITIRSEGQLRTITVSGATEVEAVRNLRRQLKGAAG